MFRPIELRQLTLSFAHKVCFEDFSVSVPYGSKIAVIGDNGSGKSALIKKLAGEASPVEGDVLLPDGMAVGYVPQTVLDFAGLSGGQRFNKKLSEALALRPDILLLDEPTNHLDIYNRRSLMNMLERFAGTLIVVSHDAELLRKHTDALWHIDNGQIHVFSGSFDDYMARHASARTRLEEEKEHLTREKRRLHENRMKEQQRAAKSRRQGEVSRERGKWAPIVAGGKERQAQRTAGKKGADLGTRTDTVNARLGELFVPEILTPTFVLDGADDSRAPLFVSGGSAGYPGRAVLKEINLAIPPAGRAALVGANASGKTTFLRAVLGDPEVEIAGSWERPSREHIGYLDQHYNGPAPQETVIGYLQSVAPERTPAQLRKHLNDFLFRKNEEVNARVGILSGGERARLALAAIACRVPRLLVLDEITNNLDLRTKNHVAQVLRAYPGAFLIVSHEPDFLKEIHVTDIYAVETGRLSRRRDMW